ncbi:Hypothetical predicted protein [Paramuricea clavata]|uniref:Uncharacterized protein n=1 Tax=Paramuricea clavata TaxID=317549 RepID=A0A6S7G8N5_PARCT|nr:Hypothetical predicted protein [Paramuricea clavata]
MSDFLTKVVKCLDQIKAQGLSNLEYDGKKLKWRNDRFAELKKIVEDSLGIKGKWSSPGGGNKRFKEENGQLILNWYFKKQCTLLFQGTEGGGLKNKLIYLLAKAKPQSFVEQEGNTPGNGGFPDEADSILAVILWTANSNHLLVYLLLAKTQTYLPTTVFVDVNQWQSKLKDKTGHSHPTKRPNVERKHKDEMYERRNKQATN